MKALIVTALLIASTTCAEASESWTCSYTLSADSKTLVARFEMAPPDVIDTGSKEHYRILQNNDYGMVATLGVSKMEADQPIVGAASIVINKGTGEFWWNNIFSGPARFSNGSAHGKCQKE